MQALGLLSTQRPSWIPTVSFVAGIDSSTQACKVVVRDTADGRLVRQGRAPHPRGSEINPAIWESALCAAVADAGGLHDVAGIAVGGQQHGMICLDEDGEVVRPALLWNDTRSAEAATELIAELGGGTAGRQAWADAVGLVPIASFTITKLRWLAEHERANASRTAAVCLPHDWLTWRLAGAPGIDKLVTDRGDASGTGYWSAATGKYRHDLLVRAFGATPAVPRVLAPAEAAGFASTGAVLGPGSGDNAAAAFGLAAEPGDVVVSIGTSGVVSMVSTSPTADPTGTVAGFADATGNFLPLVATLNAARALDAIARMLGVDHAGLSRLALSAPAGAGGLVLVPYLDGERTPDRPTSTGALHGLTLTTAEPAYVARAAVEGLLCGLADGLDAVAAGTTGVRRVFLIGGGSNSAAVRAIAPAIFGVPVLVPLQGEYVADGAARQAAWVLGGGDAPDWLRPGIEVHEADPVPHVRERYGEVCNLTAERI